jgi:ligand-binding sensor domain-containing protein/anti-sigma regulatory factor (Ser/Thr protein kinase)
MCNYCKFLLLILFTVTKVTITKCQVTNDKLVQFTQENGLPSNEVYCVFKDSKGYMWMGTDRGVVQYNGISFKKYELPDNVVFKIKEDKDGRVWFFTYTGKISYYSNQKIYEYKYNEFIKKNTEQLLISDAYIYPDGSLYLKSYSAYNYLITTDGKIKKIKNNTSISTIDTLIIEEKIGAEILCNKISSQEKITKGIYIKDNIITKKGFFITNYEENTTRFNFTFLINEVYYIFIGKNIIALKNDKILYKKNVTGEIISCMYNYQLQQFWIGTRHSGAVCLDIKLNIIESNILSTQSISSICLDDNNNIWLSSLESGLFIKKIMSQNVALKVTEDPSFRIATTQDSLIFYNTNNGIKQLGKATKQVSKTFDENCDITFEGENTLISYSKNIESNSKNTIEKKHLTIANKKYTYINFLLIAKKIILCDSSLCLISRDRIEILPHNIYENILAGKEIEKTNNDIIVNYDAYIRPLLGHVIKAASLLNCNNILLGTTENLYLYNFNRNSLSLCAPQIDIFKKGVNYITPFQNNNQALAIRSGGLAVIKDTAVLVHITELDGLIDNSITYILPDSNKLWLTSNKGLSCVTFQSLSPVKYIIKNFGKEVGLGNEIIYQIIRFKKDILAATSKGIFKLVNADSLLTVPPKPIPFYITTISTYLGDTSNVTSINLPFNKSRVSINFDAIEFATPKDIEYFYRIKNDDSTWFSISNPQLILQDLSPGTYTVEIKATLLKQGRESEIKQITITIEKPWWLKTISLVAFAFGIIGLLYLFTNWRIKKAKKAAQEKNEIANKMLKLEQNALQAQMNPHFIFNCLTGIQQLMNTNNIDEANEYLVTFSRLIRSTLENSTQEFIVLQDEIDYLKQYISLEEKRLTNSLITHFNIAYTINTQAIELPNMMLQPIIENAIRHGLKPLENKAGEIVINFSVNNNTLECIITDNGIGREASALNKTHGISSHKSFGLSIIKQRLQGYSKSYNQNYSIEIIDLKNENNIALGTKVILHLPIKN